MGNKNNKSFFKTLWNAFKSVKLTFFILIILAIISIVGTLIPQQEEGERFLNRIPSGKAKVIRFLRLHDMYHSIWFRTIVGILAMNLVVCSLSRLPNTIRLVKFRPKEPRERLFKDIPEDQVLTYRLENEKILGKINRLLDKRYNRKINLSSNDSVYIYADRGRYSYFGVYLVHLSVLLIIIGAILGSIWGYEGYMNIAEGEAKGKIFLRNSMKLRPLGFLVRCKDFSISLYSDGTPKEYRSDLQFIMDGKVVREGALLVNHPIEFKGINFYQSHYGLIPSRDANIIIRYGINEKQYNLSVGKSEDLPQNDGKFMILRLDTDLKGIMGPAALISVFREGKEIRFWIFKNFKILKRRFPDEMFSSPILNPSLVKPYTFILKDISARYYTGIQITYDPGIPVVWIGFVLLVVSLIIIFFTSHQRIWIKIIPNIKKIEITGTCNKHPVSLEKEIRYLYERLKRYSEGDK